MTITINKNSPILQSSAIKRWGIHIIVLFLFPLLFFYISESILALINYGYSSKFFISEPGNQWIKTNPQFGFRFYPKEYAPHPIPYTLSKKNTSENFRIFMLGGSEVIGSPEPSYSFTRYLDTMIRHVFPEKQIEIVNTGLTGANSHVILPIAQDCIKNGADLLVVYMGNNEVIGPYGVYSTSNDYSPNFQAIKMGISLRSYRTGQLMDQIVDYIKRNITFNPINKTPPNWIQQFQLSSQDLRLKKIYDHFQNNIDLLIQSAHKNNIPIIFCTIPVNLKCCPPFLSSHRSHLSAEALETWQSYFFNGVQDYKQSKLDQSLDWFQKARDIDNEYAELFYYIGQIKLHQKKYNEAIHYFSQARDFDLFRFRADSNINHIIRQFVSSHQGINTYLVDAEQIAKETLFNDQYNQDNDLFYDHIHLNNEGNYLIAKALFQKIIPLIDNQYNSPSRIIPNLSLAYCNDKIGYTALDELAMKEKMIQLFPKQPFNRISNQSYYFNQLLRYQINPIILTN